jgi:hypothetical protein
MTESIRPRDGTYTSSDGQAASPVTEGRSTPNLRAAFILTVWYVPPKSAVYQVSPQDALLFLHILWLSEEMDWPGRLHVSRCPSKEHRGKISQYWQVI